MIRSSRNLAFFSQLDSATSWSKDSPLADGTHLVFGKASIIFSFLSSLSRRFCTLRTKLGYKIATRGKSQGLRGMYFPKHSFFEHCMDHYCHEQSKHSNDANLLKPLVAHLSSSFRVAFVRGQFASRRSCKTFKSSSQEKRTMGLTSFLF